MWSPSTPANFRILPTALFVALLGVAVSQKMGPFKVVIQNLENCGPKTGKGFLYEPHIRRYNRSIFVVDTNVTMTMDMDDTLDLAVDMSIFTNGGWKANYYKQTFHKACSTARFYGNDLVATILKSVGVKPACPIPKGNYTVKSLPLTMEIPGIPAFFYNKYKWKGKIVEKGGMVGCLETIVDVVPKKRN